MRLRGERVSEVIAKARASLDEPSRPFTPANFDRWDVNQFASCNVSNTTKTSIANGVKLSSKEDGKLIGRTKGKLLASVKLSSEFPPIASSTALDKTKVVMKQDLETCVDYAYHHLNCSIEDIYTLSSLVDKVLLTRDHGNPSLWEGIN